MTRTENHLQNHEIVAVHLIKIAKALFGVGNWFTVQALTDGSEVQNRTLRAARQLKFSYNGVYFEGNRRGLYRLVKTTK